MSKLANQPDRRPLLEMPRAAASWLFNVGAPPLAVASPRLIRGQASHSPLIGYSVAASRHRAVLLERLRYLLMLIAIGGAYFGAARLGLQFAFVEQKVTLIWPPTGIGLAAVLIFGYRVTPALAAGAFIANMSTGSPLLFSVATAIGNPLEAVVGAFLLTNVVNFRNQLDRIRDVLGLILLAAGFSTTVSATIGVTGLGLSDVIAWHEFPAVWLRWWLGDAMGNMIVAPALLTWAVSWSLRSQPARLLEAVALATVVACATYYVFLTAGNGQGPLAYLLFPPLVWAAFRFGTRGAASVTVFVSVFATAGAVDGLGPFNGGSQDESLLLTVVYLSVLSLTSLTLGAIVAERNRARGEAQQLNVDVQASSAELKAQQIAALNLAEDTEMAREKSARAEAILAAQALELARSNAELEQFAYVAAHDLQEPLRIITTHCDLLRSRCEGRLDAEADDYINFVVDAATRMRALVKDLLTYSRVAVSENGMRLERIECEQVLNGALANLSASIQENAAVVTHGALPTVTADPIQIGQLFQNLIGNAIKFHGDQPPEVHVGAKKKRSAWLFSVADNGIGIDREYAEKVFAIFERLHKQGQYPGTGIGLAICKRIVERHGGRIWFESEPGNGSTFYFSLPAERRQSV